MVSYGLVARAAPFAAAALIIAIVFTVIAPANNYAALLFSFHPILMTAAFVCFMPMALTSYRLQALDATGHSATPRTLSQLRGSHIKWQIAAGVASLSGLAVIIINKVVHAHPALSSSTHAVVGFATMGGVFIQATSGILKVRALEASGRKTLPWHGIFGLFVYSAGVFALCLGALKSLQDPMNTVVIVGAVLVWVLVVATRVWLPFAAQGAADGESDSNTLI